MIFYNNKNDLNKILNKCKRKSIMMIKKLILPIFDNNNNLVID